MESSVSEMTLVIIYFRGSVQTTRGGIETRAKD